MEKVKVRLLNDPVLRKKARQVTPEDLKKQSLNSLIETMLIVMKDESGIGLAANQIGSPLSVFVLGLDNTEHFINARILDQSDLIEFEEACLSIPGASAITKRFNKLTLHYYTLCDTTLKEHTKSFEGKKAIAIQHEIDHLNGKLYIDQFSPMKKSMVVGKHKKFIKNIATRS